MPSQALSLRLHCPHSRPEGGPHEPEATARSLTPRVLRSVSSFFLFFLSKRGEGRSGRAYVTIAVRSNRTTLETTFLRPPEMDASPPRRMNKARLPPGYNHPGILDSPLPLIPRSPLRRPRSPPAPRAPPAERRVRVSARPTGPPRAAEPLPDRRAPCPPQVHRRGAPVDTTS